MNSFIKILLFSAIFLHSLPLFPQASTLRADPPFWWAGMENPSLQVMFHGNKIAESNIVLDYPGVMLKRTIRLENPNYLILDLEIAKDALRAISLLFLNTSVRYYFHSIMSLKQGQKAPVKGRALEKMM